MNKVKKLKYRLSLNDVNNEHFNMFIDQFNGKQDLSEPLLLSIKFNGIDFNENNKMNFYNTAVHLLIGSYCSLMFLEDLNKKIFYNYQVCTSFYKIDEIDIKNMLFIFNNTSYKNIQILYEAILAVYNTRNKTPLHCLNVFDLKNQKK